MSVDNCAGAPVSAPEAQRQQHMKEKLRLYQLHGFEGIGARLRRECGKLAQSSENAWIPDSGLHGSECAPTFVERVIAQLAEVLRQHSHLRAIAGAEYWVQVRKRGPCQTPSPAARRPCPTHKVYAGVSVRARARLPLRQG